MKKLLAAPLLGGLSVAVYALSQPPPGQNDIAKTAREMEQALGDTTLRRS